MMNKVINSFQEQKLVWVIWWFVVLIMVSFLISNIIPNDNEGYLAVYFAIADFMSICFLAILGIFFGYIGLSSDYDTTPFVGLSIMLIMLIIVLFYFSDKKNKVYYAIFEPKKSVVTNNYKLLDIPNSRSPTEYYLYIGENNRENIDEFDDRVSINQKTYYKLNRYTRYNLLITYKPKAEILYELQISPKE